MARKIQFRRGTAASWTSTNPTLAIGELGLETDTGKMKIGDGTTAWTSRPYIDAAAVAHIAASAGAHAASAIANTPAGGIAATTVQAALNELDTEKAPLASPALTGTPTAPTAATSTSTTQVATTAFVQQERAAQAATDSSRYTPGVFTVDSYLLSLYSTTPASATSAQTLAAYNTARDAAYAVGGTVKFTPGRTYQIDDVFIIKSAMTFDCSGATLKKRNGAYLTPLIVNEDWAAGNTDITILAAGAVWDFNGRQGVNGSGRTYGGLGDCVHLQNVDRLRIFGRPLIKDASKFALMIGHADDIHVDGALFDTRSDGCHLYGPMRRAKFGTFTGTTGDDFFSITISDYAAQITNLTNNGETTTLGDFEDIDVDCLQIENDVLPTGGATYGSGFAILGNSASYKVRRCTVGSILGRSKQAVRITNDANLTATYVEDISFGKIACNKGSVSSQVYLAPTVADTITIGEIVGTDTAASVLVEVNSGTIGTINIGSLTHVTGTTGGLVALWASAVVGAVNISNVNVELSTAGMLVNYLATSAVPSRINVTNFDIKSRSAVYGRGVTVGGSAVGPRLRFCNGRFKGLSNAVIATSGASTVMMDNVEMDNNLQLFEINGASTSIRALFGSITHAVAGDRSVVLYNSGKYSTTGPTARTDITKIDTASALAGDLIYNTNAAGAVGLGVAQWNGSAWALV